MPELEVNDYSIADSHQYVKIYLKRLSLYQSAKCECFSHLLSVSAMERVLGKLQGKDRTLYTPHATHSHTPHSAQSGKSTLVSLLSHLDVCFRESRSLTDPGLPAFLAVAVKYAAHLQLSLTN